MQLLCPDYVGFNAILLSCAACTDTRVTASLTVEPYVSI